MRFEGGPGVGVGEGGWEVAEWKLEVSEKSESSGEAPGGGDSSCDGGGV